MVRILKKVKENLDNYMKDFVYSIVDNKDNTTFLKEAPRVPRKKGQHRGSKSHSDLYTDEELFNV